MNDFYRNKLSASVLLFATALLLCGCAAAEADYSPSYPPEKPPVERHRPLDISLDGKVSWKNSQAESIPVHDIKVTLIDGEGKRIDSTRTNYNGRFLIERNGVAVGYNWEPRHIYVEIADDRNTEEPDGKPTYRYRRILKEIGVAPNDKAFLTMDDIVVERIEAE